MVYAFSIKKFRGVGLAIVQIYTEGFFVVTKFFDFMTLLTHELLLHAKMEDFI